MAKERTLGNTKFVQISNTTEPFTAIRVGLASSDIIRGWSRGEVKKPETINYRTFKVRPCVSCCIFLNSASDRSCLRFKSVLPGSMTINCS